MKCYGRDGSLMSLDHMNFLPPTCIGADGAPEGRVAAGIHDDEFPVLGGHDLLPKRHTRWVRAEARKRGQLDTALGITNLDGAIARGAGQELAFLLGTVGDGRDGVAM